MGTWYVGLLSERRDMGASRGAEYRMLASPWGSLAQEPPQILRFQRKRIDENAEWQQCVLHRVCQRGRDRYCSAFANALDPEKVARRWRLYVVEVEGWRLACPGQRVVHQRTSHQLTGLVVDQLLQQRTAQSLNHTAAHLDRKSTRL